MKDYQERAKIFKAFCDPNRLQILAYLRSGQKCSCFLLEKMAISQSTLSYHMKILCDAGVVVGTPDGKWTHYGLSPKGIAKAQRILRTMTNSVSTK